MGAPRRYWDELGTELAAKPTWFPGDPVELGAFGSIVEGIFRPAGRLADLNIAFEATLPSEGQPFKHQRGMKVGFAGGANASASKVDIGVEVQLESTSETGWVFTAVGMHKIEIGNIYEVSRRVLEAQKAGDWKNKHRLVTAVWRVDRLSVVVAHAKAKTAKVHAKGTFADPLDALFEASSSVESTATDFTVVRDARDATPLYSLHKLGGWLDPSLRPISSGNLPHEVQLVAIAGDEPYTTSEGA
jgi:hypothetical protein